MATKTNNEVATVETVGFSNIARLTDLKSELMECCVGMEFSMDRIKMPSGVSKFFTVPADGAEEQQVAEIVGIILHSHPSFPITPRHIKAEAILRIAAPLTADKVLAALAVTAASVLITVLAAVQRGREKRVRTARCCISCRKVNCSP